MHVAGLIQISRCSLTRGIPSMLSGTYDDLNSPI